MTAGRAATGRMLSGRGHGVVALGEHAPMLLPHRLRRLVRGGLERLDPSGLRPAMLVRRGATPPLRLAMVYRERNVGNVAHFLARVPAGTDVRLWALDRVSSRLVGLTYGEGRDYRFPLLNRLLERGAAPGTWTVLADDDV